MSNNLAVFTFSFGHDFYEVRLVGTADQPEWIAQDVCNALGLRNVSKALSTLKDSQKGITSSDTPGGQQQLLTVKESGLYKLIMRSRKACAEKFQDWVCEEVLPTIRKTGHYAVTKTTTELLYEEVGRLVEQEKQLRAVVEEQKLHSAKLASHSDRIEGVEAELTRFNNTHGRYYSICGYAAMLKIEMPLSQAAKMGKSATATCRQLGLPIGDIPDPRFGNVNTYPESVLQNLPW